MSETIKLLITNKEHFFKSQQWIGKEAKPYSWSLFFMTFFMSVSSLAVIVTAVLSQKVIDAAGLGGSFFYLAIGYILVLVITQFANMMNQVLSITVTEKYGFGIRKNIYEKILRSKWEQINSYHTGDLNTRITSDAGNVANGVVEVLPGLFVLIFEILTTFFTLFYYSRALALFSLCFAPIAVVISFLLGRKVKHVQSKLQESESTYRSYLQESISNLMIIKAYCAEDQACESFTKYRKERFYWVAKKSKLSLISSSFLDFTFQTGYVVAFLWGAYSISQQNLTFGGMTVFLTLVNRIQGPLMEMISYLPKFVTIYSSAERLMELEELEREEATKVNLTMPLGLIIDNLSFSYGEKPIFNEVNLVLKPGDCVSLMGDSGIGKTTFIRLLMSFLYPQNGEIYLTSKTEQVLLSPSMRRYISYVPQGNTILSGSVVSILSLAKPDATEEEIILALQQAQIYDTIAALPNGIHSHIGEKGSGLSEGQIQRIAIARAFIRQSPILILDEATSGLDEKTELKILQQVRNLSYKPCCIIISHRKSVLDFCNKWLTIDQFHITMKQHNQ